MKWPWLEFEYVWHMHKTGGAAAYPVGIFFAKTFHPRNNETAFGSVVGHVGSNQAPAAGELLGLLKG